MSVSQLERTLGEYLQLVQQTTPLVQCITNNVVTNFTANALLALGASAAMADLPGEAGGFSEIASGLLINLGTPYQEQRAGALEAAAHADAAGTPWVLDPVAVGGLPVRTALLPQLLAAHPTVIRGNASEIAVVVGAGNGGRGVDATCTPADVQAAAYEYAQAHQCIVAVSGKEDLVVTPQKHWFQLANGDPLLTKVTGGGCALGAIIAAFIGLKKTEPNLDLTIATLAAISTWNVAAELAAQSATGPGSFAVHLLDQVANLDAATLIARSKIVRN